MLIGRNRRCSYTEEVPNFAEAAEILLFTEQVTCELSLRDSYGVSDAEGTTRHEKEHRTLKIRLENCRKSMAQRARKSVVGDTIRAMKLI